MFMQLSGSFAGLVTIGLLTIGPPFASGGGGRYFSAGNPGGMPAMSASPLTPAPANQALATNNAWANYTAQLMLEVLDTPPLEIKDDLDPLAQLKKERFNDALNEAKARALARLLFLNHEKTRHFAGPTRGSGEQVGASASGASNRARSSAKRQSRSGISSRGGCAGPSGSLKTPQRKFLRLRNNSCD